MKQPYRIILIGEKTSLEPVLLPVAELCEGELLLPTGEASTTMIAGIARRASEDGRPAVVLYFSDFDPSGRQMPISVARKLQAFRDHHYPDLNIQVHHVALTLDQVRELGLPSTPLKETERRADRWRSVMGHEQTEIDALAALDPGKLREIAHTAIKPFRDRTLAQRVSEAQAHWDQAANQLVTNHRRYQAGGDRIKSALDQAQEAAQVLRTAQAEARRTLEDITPPEIIVPEAELSSEPPPPLFTTAEEFITATRRLIAHKQLNNPTLGLRLEKIEDRRKPGVSKR